MNFSSLQRKPVFYIIFSVFVIMVFVQFSLLNSAYKGKEKDFNDKVFYIVGFYQEHFSKDTAVVNLMKSDTVAIQIAQTRIKSDIDSVFRKNDISTDYIYGVGKSKISWIYNTLIWSSDSTYNPGLKFTKLRVTTLGGPPGSEVYYVKIFFPSKPTYIFKALLPLIVVSVLTFIILFFCFLALLSIIKRQNRLAEIKSDFINNMTHELKTPLFTISIASKMLAEQQAIKDNTKYVSYVESIQHETGRLTGLVEKVLQISALEKKQLELDKKDIDVHATIRSAIQSLELIRLENKARIDMFLDAPYHMIPADETHIVSMIYSLIDNAFKYSNGPVHITISTSNLNDTIIISIADNGIGLDMETKKLIFDRFFRANTGNLHKVKGYGIGLSYVKSVVEAHNGSIMVNSKLGKGSDFILILPCANDGNE